MLETLFGGLLGGLFRLAPEVLKFFSRKNDNAHELEMFKLQTELEKTRGDYKLSERYVDYSVAEMGAIKAAFKSQGEADKRAWKWVASLSALVRPGVTYVLFGLYVLFKMTMVVYAMQSGARWFEVVQSVWTTDDWAMLNMVLTFYFVGRPIEKYTRS